MNRLVNIIGSAPSELEPQVWLERLREIHRAVKFPEPKLPKIKEPKPNKVLLSILKDLGIKPDEIDLNDLRRKE